MKKTITPNGDIYIQETDRKSGRPKVKIIARLGNIQDRMKEFGMSREEVIQWVVETKKYLEQQKKENIRKDKKNYQAKTKHLLNNYKEWNFGYLVLQKIFYSEKLNELFSSSDFFDGGKNYLPAAQRLIYSLALERGSLEEKDFYYGLKPTSLKDVQDLLEIIGTHFQKFEQELFIRSESYLPRKRPLLIHHNLTAAVPSGKKEYDLDFDMFLDGDALPYFAENAKDFSLLQVLEKLEEFNKANDIDWYIYTATGREGSAAVRAKILEINPNNEYIVPLSMKGLPKTVKEWANSEDPNNQWEYVRLKEENGRHEIVEDTILQKDIPHDPMNVMVYSRYMCLESKEGYDEYYVLAYSAFKGWLPKREQLNGYYCAATSFLCPIKDVLKAQNEIFEGRKRISHLKEALENPIISLNNYEQVLGYLFMCMAADQISYTLLRISPDDYARKHIVKALLDIRYFQVEEDKFEKGYRVDEYIKTLQYFYPMAYDREYLSLQEADQLLEQAKTREKMDPKNLIKPMENFELEIRQQETENLVRFLKEAPKTDKELFDSNKFLPPEEVFKDIKDLLD